MLDMKRLLSAIILLLALLPAACTPQTAEWEAGVAVPVMTAEVAIAPTALPPPEVATEPTDLPSMEVSVEATATLAELAAALVVLSTATSVDSPGGESLVVYGRTDEGAYFHGAVDAPLTLIDYSDFL
jgi:hypothetical protein